MDATSLKIKVEPVGEKFQEIVNVLLPEKALQFLQDLIEYFNSDIDQLHKAREQRRVLFRSEQFQPNFLVPYERKQWKIFPLPQRLQNRHVDLGDVSPANISHFQAALHANVQGIQVDFDDGHCPLWCRHLQGLYNVVQAAKGKLENCLEEMPLMMLRPRAWNIFEHNVKIGGKSSPGPLFDFGLLMFHIGNILNEAESGPFFYLSKLESASEAKLWNEIFIWTQHKLGLPQGTIKACVLIENIAAVFEMDEILFELREHSFGLNCGIWDYSASIINYLGHRAEFILPDRNCYVDVKQHFLSSYMKLVAQTCHRRGAPATGGMAALLVPDQSKQAEMVINKIVAAKKYEIEIGLDGFLIYDLQLIPHARKLWRTVVAKQSETDEVITAEDLLSLPSGGVTLSGLKHNIAVSVLFIFHWLQGFGHFSYFGSVEDSATAEISRFQIWQWIFHQAKIEHTSKYVTAELVMQYVEEFAKKYYTDNSATCPHLLKAAECFFLEIVCNKVPPEFITSYLNDNKTFQSLAL